VIALFLVIHQIEGHIVVPKVMGSALRLHPLLVIFGLLAGAEIYGILGIFIVLPLLAVLRALWEFFSEQLTFESWAPAAATSAGVTIVESAPVLVEQSLPAETKATEASDTLVQESETERADE
jgi:hypothetical protein